MRVTQADIAKMANVSQATVSRVLAGDDRVEDTARDRVMTVVKKHNYQPDVRARSLRTARTGLIGLVLKRPHGGLVDDPFFSALIAGIMDYLVGKPYHLCVDMVTDDQSQTAVYDEMLRTRRVDGLILVEAEASDQRIELLQRDAFPFVLIGNPDNECITSVDNDNVHAGRVAAQHLVNQGFKNIGFLAGPQGVIVCEDRIEGYRQVLGEAGLESKVWYSPFGYDAAARRAHEIFTKREQSAAMIVLDDFMAFGVITAARAHGIRIPDDLAIMGFSNSTFCNLLDGGLTSISLNISLIIEHAVDLLLGLVRDPAAAPIQRVIVPCELMVRRSTARMRGDS